MNRMENTSKLTQGSFYTPWGGVNTPYFFLYTPDQFELVTPPPMGVKSRTDAKAAQGISWIGLILFVGATPANLLQQRTHIVLNWPAASLLVACRCAVARHSSRSPQTRALSFETPQLLSLLCLHARPSTGAAAARWPRLIAAVLWLYVRNPKTANI